jgi:dTDP-glucose pyrophosphorylase
MKINLLLPIAGNGQRFVDGGYQLPKPLILTNGKRIVDRSLESVEIGVCNLIFIVRKEHIEKFSIDKILKETYNDCSIITVDYLTDGALSTCLLAKEYINNNEPLVIFTPDCYFEPKIDPSTIDKKYDGMVCVFNSSSDAHSYVQLDSDNEFVIKTAEKEVISNMAIGGLYYFKTGKMFVDHAEYMIENNIRTKNEFYIAPVYNLLIEQNYKIGIDKNTRHDILGTPNDLEKINV